MVSFQLEILRQQSVTHYCLITFRFELLFEGVCRAPRRRKLGLYLSCLGNGNCSCLYICCRHHGYQIAAASTYTSKRQCLVPGHFQMAFTLRTFLTASPLML